MKKIFSVLLVVCSLVVLLTACGIKNELEVNKPDDKITSDAKAIVVYFSRAGENYSVGNIEIGNTAIMASYIVEFTNADVFEIVPKVSYPDDYEEMKTIAQREQNENARPEIKNTLEDFSQYDVVYLGYPIWYSNLPMIVRTFIESYDFTGKTVIPFCTHEGSGFGNTLTTLTSYANSMNFTLETGKSIQGKNIRLASSKNEVENWLKSFKK